MKKMSSRKRLIILCTLMICVLILVMLLIRVVTLKDDVTISKAKLEYINGNEWNNETYPEKMAAFFRAYEGKQTAQNIGKSMYHVVTELIPKYNKELKGMSKSKIKEYFRDNEKLVSLDFGIEYESEFENLMDSVLELKSDNLELESYYIDIASIKQSDMSTSAVLYIKYKDNNEISINFRVLNTVQANISSVQYY